MTNESRPDRILEDWATVSVVAAEVRRPAAAPRPVVVRSRLPGPTLASLGLVAVVVIVAAAWLGSRPPNDEVGGGVPPASLVPGTAPVSPPGSSTPTVGRCGPEDVDAAITAWEGAAGHRIADVSLTNIGDHACTVPSLSRPRLVDGGGAVLLDGISPSGATLLTMVPGDVLRTLVDTANYCGPAPSRLVTVAFVQDDESLIVATALGPKDATVPPCNGPGSPGSIQMQPWAVR